MKLNENGQQTGTSMLPMFIMFILLIMIFLNPGLFQMIGVGIGYVLNPVIGFGGSLPLITILFASMIMSLTSTLIRHKFIDWTEMAKNQKVMSAFNKERRDALLSKNTAKLKRLSELQPEIMKKTMKASTGQLKPMMFTMVIIIIFFAWLSAFLVIETPFTTFSVPWNFHVPLTSALVFPYWIMLYFLASLPLGMVFQRVLKYYSFKKKLIELEGKGFMPIKKPEELKIPERKRKMAKRERAETNFTCTICYKRIRKGRWAYKCKCGKYYHEHCSREARKCPTCGKILFEDKE